MKVCRYAEEFECRNISECRYSSILDCFQQTRQNQRDLIIKLEEGLKTTRDKTSVKWKSQAFYYKNKAKQLEAHLTSKGLEVPQVKELRKEEHNDGISSDHKETPC